MASTDDIVLTGDPVLKKECAPVDEITDEIAEFAQTMLDEMYEANGCGLAAPQLGRPIQMVVIDVDWADGVRNPYVLINPEIVETSEETAVSSEGCLSFPGISVPVERPRHVVVEAMDLDGDILRYDAEDSLLAVCLQHEIDHLHGITMVDHLGPVERLKAMAEVRKAIAEGIEPGETSRDGE